MVNMVTKYGIDKTGKVDASAAISQAIKTYDGTGAILYLPAGTYMIAKEIDFQARGVTLMGAGQDTTTLRVPDNINFSSYVIKQNTYYSLNAFQTNIYDLTVNTGSGNPKANGIMYYTSNQGSLENVTVTSGDGQGVEGIWLSSPNGPGLIKNVTVNGFSHGINALWANGVNLTMEHIRLNNQSAGGFGLGAGSMALAVRDLQSNQKNANVPGIMLCGQASQHLSLIDSTLHGTGGKAIALFDSNPVHYQLRNVTTTGYVDSYPGERVSDPILTSLSSSQVTLGLPVKETPDEWDNNPDHWAAVANSNGSDDTQNFQNALNAGKSVVYFPRFNADGSLKPRYGFGSNVTFHIPSTVKYILGMGAQIDTWGYADGSVIFKFEGGSASDTVYFRDFRINSEAKNITVLQASPPRSLVLSHLFAVGAQGNHGWFFDGSGPGSLYVEDVGNFGGWRFNGMHVWARQINPEDLHSDGSSALIDSQGSQVWILGLKTEGFGPFIKAYGGGSIELFGGRNEVPVKSHTDLSSDVSIVMPGATGSAGFHGNPLTAMVPYQLTDVDASLSFSVYNVGFNPKMGDYANYIQVTRDGTNAYVPWSPRVYCDPGHEESYVFPLFVSKRK